MSLTILQFDVGQIACAFAVHEVVEVVRIVALTRVPNAHEAFAGVVNLRGTVLPVLDLRACLREPCRAFDVDTRIIIVPLSAKASAAAEPLGHRAVRLLGLIVDRVNDVETVAGHAAPATARAPFDASGHVTTIIQGLDRLIMVLDPHTLITAELSESIEIAWSAPKLRGVHAA